jgi:hypothetical protein
MKNKEMKMETSEKSTKVNKSCILILPSEITIKKKTVPEVSLLLGVWLGLHSYCICSLPSIWFQII